MTWLLFSIACLAIIGAYIIGLIDGAKYPEWVED